MLVFSQLINEEDFDDIFAPQDYDRHYTTPTGSQVTIAKGTEITPEDRQDLFSGQNTNNNLVSNMARNVSSFFGTKTNVVQPQASIGIRG